MSSFRPVLILSLILAFAACSRKEPPPEPADAAAESSTPTKAAAQADESSSTEAAAEEGPPPDETAPISFESQLEFVDDVYRVKVYGEGNRKLLVVQATRGGKPVGDPATTILDGDVVQSYATDLDGDQSGELLVFVRSRGKGRPGSIAGFAFSGARFTPLTMPALDAAQAAGYHGGDAFSLDGKHVVRKFPVFEGDGDQPTGKVRTITYSLQPGFEFGVDKIEG